FHAAVNEGSHAHGGVVSSRHLVHEHFLHAVVGLDGVGKIETHLECARFVGQFQPVHVAVNANNGHLFIVNGDQVAGPTARSIVEIDNTGTQVFSTIVLPAEIKDPEALVYDASHDVFYVGGGFSPDVWVVDRSGNILQKLDVLEGYRHETNNTAVNVKDLELAPSSDPNDDPATLNLYVADYGWSHVSDGRMLEIDLHGGLLLA